MNQEFDKRSYKAHEKAWDNNKFNHERLKKINNVDMWRHERMYNTINTILEFNKNKKYLTIDGNYGDGARHIQKYAKYVMATDIDITYLKKAKENGVVDKILKANAEALPFRDNEFDFSFCKESYHHFPKPMIALYEMLRVSKDGIILIEPNDAFVNIPITRSFLRFIKLLCGKKVQKHSYEKVGNYVYTISRRDIEKIALGLNYKVIAFKGINDHYIAGKEAQASSNIAWFKNKIKRKIIINNIFCQLKLTDYALLTSVIFKKKPSELLLRKMQEDGFEVIILPNNPYA